MDNNNNKNKLGRPLTTTELIQIQKAFSSGRGYKDLKRDFKKCFNVDITNNEAKQFMANRSWREILTFLTGDEIAPPDAADLIPSYDIKHYELLEAMIKEYKPLAEEQNKLLTEYEQQNYYIPDSVKYFNFPIYGEIITYQFKEPFIKCFLLDVKTRKINKIEDIPITDKLPDFLLRVIRKINHSKILSSKPINEILNNAKYDLSYYIEQEEADKESYKNILDSDLFKYYKFAVKSA